MQIERINRWTFVGELCIHGNPSGLDNTVSSGGSAVLFQRSSYSKPPTVTVSPKFPELPLLLVNTHQSRSTAVEVAKVGKLRKSHPQVTEAMLDTIDQVTMLANKMIRIRRGGRRRGARNFWRALPHQSRSSRRLGCVTPPSRTYPRTSRSHQHRLDRIDGCWRRWMRNYADSPRRIAADASKSGRGTRSRKL